MASDPIPSATDPLIDEFRQRFPLLARIVGEFGEGGRERVPWFFAFLLAAANSPKPGGCCFVLDASPGTTAIAALLTALDRLKAEFPRLVEDYAKHAFKRGQRVRVLPSDAVFEYEGLWPEFPGQFKLRLLGTDTASFRSFPLADVLRLEPTDRLRPRGTGATNLGQRASGPLDRLLAYSSFGNNSIIRNRVLCYMPRTQFAGVINSVTLAPASARAFDRLSEFLPWGSIGPDGFLHPNNTHQTVGEPLIAVSGIPEDIARNCRDATTNSKVVFANGLQSFARDLQAYDDVVASQRLILVASPTDIDEIQTLRDRGCIIWRMAAGEMLLGEGSPVSRSRASLVGRTIRAADIRRRAVVSAIDCTEEKIEAIARALESASASFHENDQTIELEDALARLFGVLFECSECCFGGQGTALQSIEAARASIARNARWLPPEGAARLRQAIDGLVSISCERTCHAKAGALVDLLSDRVAGKGERWVVVGRSVRTCSSLAAGLREYELTPVVTAVSSLTPESEYDGIVLAGWPNDARFTRLLELEVAADIRVLMYRFEKKWFDRYRVRVRQRSSSDILTAEQRAQIVQVSPSRLNGAAIHDPFAESDESPPSEAETRLFDFEARVALRHSDISVPPSDSSHEIRPARLVRFAGGCHAFLTEWAQLSILNEVIERGGSDGAKIVRKTVTQFIPGDFLLFRAAGDKEFIRLIAEEMMGSEEYDRARRTAERWKTALHSLGSSPAAVQRRLAEFGLDRTAVTVGSWLGDPDKIGPGNKHDIEIMAEAAGDSDLLASLPQVNHAIFTIRSAHLSAGMRLTRLILHEIRGRIADIRDEPTLLDLGYGEAWVVQVETIDSEQVNCPANKTNRLLRDAQTEL
jgi:hypothetical protein